MPQGNADAYLDPEVMAAIAGNPSQVDAAPRAQPVQPDIMGMSFAERKQFADANPDLYRQLLLANERPSQAPQATPQQMQEKLLPGAVPVGTVEQFTPFGPVSKTLANPNRQMEPVPRQPQAQEDPGFMMSWINWLLGN